MRRVAVVGGGFAGVALSWHLLQRPDVSLELFDAKGIGGGASGISTGLLHSFPGKRARKSWKAAEGMEATLELLSVAEAALGSPVAEKTGIFRPAIEEEQRRDFLSCAEKHSDAIWCKKPPFGEGLWIPSGVSVYSRLFLQGLWLACEKRGALFCQRRISSLDELAAFDPIFLAAGAETLHFPECRSFSLSVTKGQSLLCRWPERAARESYLSGCGKELAAPYRSGETPSFQEGVLQKLPFALASIGHIAPTEDPSLCVVGSTYEHNFSSLDPDPTTALPLLEQASRFYPPARHFEVVEIRSGGRIGRREDVRPHFERITPKAWVVTGLGSRGLLYAGWVGRTLVESLTLLNIFGMTKNV